METRKRQLLTIINFKRIWFSTIMKKTKKDFLPCMNQLVRNWKSKLKKLKTKWGFPKTLKSDSRESWSLSSTPPLPFWNKNSTRSNRTYRNNHLLWSKLTKLRVKNNKISSKLATTEWMNCTKKTHIFRVKTKISRNSWAELSKTLITIKKLSTNTSRETTYLGSWSSYKGGLCKVLWVLFLRFLQGLTSNHIELNERLGPDHHLSQGDITFRIMKNIGQEITEIVFLANYLNLIVN